MRVMIIRLTTGEELIGSWDDMSKTISTPALVAVGSNPLNNQMKVQLVPWAMFAKDNSVQLNPDHITYVAEPDEQIYNRYNQVFGSGIQIATGNIQL